MRAIEESARVVLKVYNEVEPSFGQHVLVPREGVEQGRERRYREEETRECEHGVQDYDADGLREAGGGDDAGD